MGQVGSSLNLPARGWVGCGQGQLLPGFPPAIRDNPLAGSVAAQGCVLLLYHLLGDCLARWLQ